MFFNYSYKQLATLFGITSTNQRLYLTEVFKDDTSSGLSPGTVNRLSIDQLFLNFLCSEALGPYRVPLSEVRRLSEALPEWLARRKYCPIEKHLKKRVGQIQEQLNLTQQVLNNQFQYTGSIRAAPRGKYIDWVLCISRTSAGYHTVAKGYIYKGMESSEHDLIVGREEYIAEHVTNRNENRLGKYALSSTFVDVTDTLFEFLQRLDILRLKGPHILLRRM